MAEVALKFPFTLDVSTGNILSANTQEAIWADRVRLAIETLVGERVMRPSYGTEIPSAVMNTVTAMENSIYKGVRKIFVDQFPLLELVSVSSSHDAETNTITAEINYKLPNKKETSTKAGVIVVSDSNPLYEELS
jgi:phage baseplate assembly protein W